MDMLLVMLLTIPFIVSYYLIKNTEGIGVLKGLNRVEIINQLIVIILNVITCLIIYPLILERRSLKDLLIQAYSRELAYQDMFLIIRCNLISIILAVLFAEIAKYFFRVQFLDLRYYRASKKNKIKMLIPILTGLLIYISIGSIANDGISDIYIDEICRKYEIVTENGLQERSYVSIYNDGEYAQKINRIYLCSDDEDNKAVYEALYIPAKGTIRLEDSFDSFFEIKKKGGTTIFLYDETKELIDEVEVAGLGKNESYKKVMSEEEEWEIVQLDTQIMAADIENENCIYAPVLSHASGFYEDEIMLTIEASPGTKVYYTTDGAYPTSDSLIYEGPIRVYDKSAEENKYRSEKKVISDYNNKWKEPDKVDKAFIIRAVAIDSEGNTSDEVNATYFINQDEYKDKKILSIIVDPEDLFGEKGIYVVGKEYEDWYEEKSKHGSEIDFTDAPEKNYKQRGIEWERLANLEILEGDEKLNQKVGIRIQGGGSREFDIKRFSVYARKEYSGSNRFDIKMLDGLSLHKIVLRDGFMNVLGQKLNDGRDVASLDSEKATLFINGEFWCDTFILPKYDSNYLSQRYAVDENNVNISTIGTGNVNEPAANKLKDVISYVTKDGWTYEKLNSMIDIQSYVDYMCFNIYIANGDFFEKHNTSVWYTDIHENDTWGDGRLRWALYDLDCNSYALRKSQGKETAAEANAFPKQRYGEENYAMLWPLYRELIQQEDIKKSFVLTFMDMINTTFSEKRVKGILEELGRDMSFDKHFFENRKEYIIPQIYKEYELKGKVAEVTISSNVENASIRLNTVNPGLIEDEENGNDKTYIWTGYYFTDYPISLTAYDTGDKIFDRWKIIQKDKTVYNTEKTIEVQINEEGVEISAIFK